MVLVYAEGIRSGFSGVTDTKKRESGLGGYAYHPSPSDNVGAEKRKMDRVRILRSGKVRLGSFLGFPLLGCGAFSVVWKAGRQVVLMHVRYLLVGYEVD
jgi:hypothetical protein